MWKRFHPNLEKVIDLALIKHFACEEHLIQFVIDESPEWGEPWWTVDHINIKYHSSKLSHNLISLIVSNNFGIEYF